MIEQDVVKYIGLPYVPRELDCWQLIRKFVRQELGQEYPDFFYDAETLNEMSAEHIQLETSSGSRWRSVGEPTLGDVLIFRLRGKACHTGVYVFNNNFLHTLAGRASAYEPLDGYWKQALVGIYRWSPNESLRERCKGLIA